jgi:hypothetical protein
MKRFVVLMGFVAFFGLKATAAIADPISINFCPGDSTCPVGVTEASITFAEILGGDPNDYTVTLRITGDSTAPAYVDELMFKVSSAQWTDYETLPQLQSAPSGGTTWLSYFDNISGSAGSCTSNTGQQQAVCAQSGPGIPSNYGAPLAGDVLEWTFLVDFKDAFGTLGDDDIFLRAQFLTSSGGNAGILSPTGVPEPSTLLLTMLGILPFIPRRRRTKVRS